MGWRTKYDVAFKGLNEGLHEFEYEIGDEFFEHFDQGLVCVGNLDVKVNLEKRSTFMKLYFSIKGWVELTCDRCLENYRQKIKNNAEIYIKFGHTKYEDDEIISVLPEEHQINLAQLIYEYTVLSIPLKRIHPGKNGCNPEMIQRLDNYIPGEEENNSIIDPRWEVLRKLKNNN